MENKDVLIVHPQTNEQILALKAFMEALKIKFEIAKAESYNPEFVEKINESRRQAKNGKVTRVKKEALKEFLGL